MNVCIEDVSLHNTRAHAGNSGFDRNFALILKHQVMIKKHLSSLFRYGEILKWLIREIWQDARRNLIMVFGLDVIALLFMILSYYVAKQIISGDLILGRNIFSDGEQMPSEVLAGLSAVIVSVGLLFHAGCQLYSKRAALAIVEPMQFGAIQKIWGKTAEVYHDDEFYSEVGKSRYHRFITTFGRTIGMSSRLAVMAMSAVGTAIGMIIGAAYLSIQTVIVFAVVGLVAGLFLARSNRIASKASTLYRESNMGARKLVGDALKTPGATVEREELKRRLIQIYKEGPGSVARMADLKRLFQIYQGQFLLKIAAAAGVCLSLALVFVQESGDHGVLQHVAIVVGSILLMKQAFGFLGAAAGFLTRLNLQYVELISYKGFLEHGVFPASFSVTDEEEEM